MFTFFKNLLSKKNSQKDNLITRTIHSEKEKGCSPKAANLILNGYKNGEITEDRAFSYIDNLCYCNDIPNLIERFAVNEEPKEKKKKYKSTLAPVIGAIYGDIIGSKYEGHRITDISDAVNDPKQPSVHLTDDSILTIATLKEECSNSAIKYYKRKICLQDIDRNSSYPVQHNPYTRAYKDMARRFGNAGYGGSFLFWAANNDDRPYGSLGNGSAMRVSPIGAIHENIEDVIERAAVSAIATHNHVEGVKGAVVTAVCIWMARKGYSKLQIFRYMKKHYSYGASIHLFSDFTYREASSIKWNQVECSYSVPAAIISFCESKDYMDAIRLSACVGFDTDTNACICGGIAGAYYGIPDKAEEVVKAKTKELFKEDVFVLNPIKHMF